MINRKGQLAEGITAPIVFFIVFVIMVLFVAMSAGVFNIVHPTKEVASATVDPKIPYSYELLFKTLDINVGDVDRHLTVFDILTLSLDEKVNIADGKETFATLLSPDRPCLIAALDNPKNTHPDVGLDYCLKYTPGEKQAYTEIYDDYDKYKNAGVLSKVDVSFMGSKQMRSIVYYYGKCLT